MAVISEAFKQRPIAVNAMGGDETDGGKFYEKDIEVVRPGIGYSLQAIEGAKKPQL